MEFAGDPNKMSKILGSFNSANLGEVSNAGTIQGTKTELNSVLNNAKAEDARAEMIYKAAAADATRDYDSEIAGMERDSARTNAFLSGAQSIAGGVMKGSDFSLFGNKGGSFDSTAASPGGASGVSGIGGGMSNPFSRDDYYSL